MVKTRYNISAKDTALDRIPLGKAMPGSEVMVIQNGKLCETLVPGELYIRSPYITHGYYQDDQLNAERFVNNPLSDNPHDLLYKTGDMGRKLVNGDLEFLGRQDNQLKIRGNRVETVEIENLLLSHSQVDQCVVIGKRNDTMESELHSYYSGDVEVDVLRSYLSHRLPDYMVPSYMIEVSEWPLLPNGKIDRKALPEPKAEVVQGKTAETKSERAIHSLWQEILKTDSDIDIDKNFFEVGGNSLKLMTMISKIHREYGVRMPIGEFFKRPTIVGMSIFLRENTDGQFIAIKPREKQQFYALTETQKRLYFVQSMDTQSTAYNMPMVVDITNLDKTAVERALNILIQRHESLRTSFELIGEAPAQRVWDTVDFELEDLDGEVSDFVRPFDLSQAPLLRGGTKRVDNKTFLVIDIHHIINDATSEMILRSDFEAIMNGVTLAPLQLQYKDYVKWKSSDLNTKNLVKQRDFWANELSGSDSKLALPYDRQPDIYTDNAIGAVKYVVLDKDLSGKIKLLIEGKNGYTTFSYFMAVYNTLLFKYSHQNDIIVGFPYAGRDYDGLEKVVGYFINTLVLRSFPQLDISFSTYVKEVKVKLEQSLENADCPYNEIIQHIQSDSRNRSVKTLFTLQNAYNTEEYALDESKLGYTSKMDMGGTDTKFDLFIDVFEYKENFALRLSYAKELFQEETVDTIGNHLIEIIRKTVNDKDVSLGEIQLTSDIMKSDSYVPMLENEEFDF